MKYGNEKGTTGVSNKIWGCPQPYYPAFSETGRGVNLGASGGEIILIII